jgi:hypothetical protein
MMSHFDQIPCWLKCDNPQCRKVVVAEQCRIVLEANVVVCPHCRTTIDIRESKRTGHIGSWINMVQELDKIHKVGAFAT